MLRYGSAGHPAILMHADGTVLRLDSHTPPLGVHIGKSEVSDEIKLSEGDVLVLYTDGLIERLNVRSGMFGLNRMLEVLSDNRHRTAEEIIECILVAVRSFSGGVAQADDETLVIVKVGSTR